MDIAKDILAFVRSELGGGAARKVRLDTPLLTGVIDSMEAMELITFLEESFGISLEFSDMNEENFRDVRALAELVSRKLG